MICLVSTVVIHFVFITCHRTCFEGQQRSLSALQPLQRPAESGALPPKAEGQRMIYRETGFMLGFGELNSKSSQKHGENVNQSGLKSIWNLCRKDGCLVAQSCLTLCDLVDCSPPGSSVHGILQARILEWVATSFSRGIFPTQRSNLHLPYRQANSLTTEPPGKQKGRIGS